MESRSKFEQNIELPKDIKVIIEKLETKIIRINETGTDIFEKIINDSKLLPEDQRREYVNLQAQESDFQYQINILKLLKHNIELIVDVIYDFHGLKNNKITPDEKQLISSEIIKNTLNELKTLTPIENLTIINLYLSWSEINK